MVVDTQQKMIFFFFVIRLDLGSENETDTDADLIERWIYDTLDLLVNFAR